MEFAAKIGFYGVAAATLAGAWFTVSARNLFRAALGLALALFGVAGLFLYMEAEFLAAVQLLVYVGAILTLMIFGIMLTHRIADPNLKKWNRQSGRAGIVSAVIGVGLSAIFLKASWNQSGADFPPVPVPFLGRAILTTQLLAFELLSLLLLGALVGSLYIARKEKRC